MPALHASRAFEMQASVMSLHRSSIVAFGVLVLSECVAFGDGNDQVHAQVVQAAELQGERKFGPIESRHKSQDRNNLKVDKQQDKICATAGRESKGHRPHRENALPRHGCADRDIRCRNPVIDCFWTGVILSPQSPRDRPSVVALLRYRPSGLLLRAEGCGRRKKFSCATRAVPEEQESPTRVERSRLQQLSL